MADFSLCFVSLHDNPIAVAKESNDKLTAMRVMFIMLSSI